MRCSKCGEECREGLNFCLRCGTPIQNIPKEDIEEQLKENVEDIIDDVKEVRVPFHDLIDKIDIDDDDEDSYGYDEDDEELDLVIGRDLSRIGNNRRIQLPEDDEDDESESEEKKNGLLKSKKNIAIIAVISAVIIAAVIFIIVTWIGNNKSYSEYYQKGTEYMESGDYKSAAGQFEHAVSAAENDKQKTDAYVMLWSAYSQIDGYESEKIEALEALIELVPDEITYYQALLTLYQDTDQTDKIEKLLASIEDENLKAQLKEFDTNMPTATAVEGTYSEPVTVGLSASADRDIYYTLDGTVPDTSSTKYIAAIELDEEGTYVLSAISVDNSGNASAVFTATYVLDFGSVSSPTVSLETGTYNEQQEIEVTAGEGCTIYYTTDGSMPTTSSKQYTEPFYMDEGNNVYSFIAVNSSGVSSDVVSCIYILEPGYTYSYDSAVTKLTSELVSNGTLENSYGEFSDGSVMYFSYRTTTLIDHNYYYIITASKESAAGVLLSETSYAFGVDTGKIYAAKYGTDGYELSGAAE